MKEFVLPILTRFGLTCGRLTFENNGLGSFRPPLVFSDRGYRVQHGRRELERLFCFHAGGGATSYYSWRAPLRVRGGRMLQLPNRETRFHEALAPMAELVDGFAAYRTVSGRTFSFSAIAWVR